MKPVRFAAHTYDRATHAADTPCKQTWFWCRIHWWTMFETNGEKWYEPYPVTVNRKVDDVWTTTMVHCGPGTFYPKPEGNRSYAKR